MQESGWNQDMMELYVMELYVIPWEKKKKQYFSNLQNFLKVFEILLKPDTQFLWILLLVFWRRNSLEGNAASVTCTQRLSEHSCVVL